MLTLLTGNKILRILKSNGTVLPTHSPGTGVKPSDAIAVNHILPPLGL
jgi:hypothetical protein